MSAIQSDSQSMETQALSFQACFKTFEYSNIEPYKHERQIMNYRTRKGKLHFWKQFRKHQRRKCKLPVKHYGQKGHIVSGQKNRISNMQHWYHMHCNFRYKSNVDILLKDSKELQRIYQAASMWFENYNKCLRVKYKELHWFSLSKDE